MVKKVDNEYFKREFNSLIKTEFKNNYEFNRWFSDVGVRRGYFMTCNSILYQLNKVSFASCLELGPGPGTWTKILFRKNVRAQFDLVDISKEMKTQFILEMRNQKNVNYAITNMMKLRILFIMLKRKSDPVERAIWLILWKIVRAFQ